MNKLILVDGSNLLEFMVELDLTQEELAKLSGVSDRTIRRLTKPGARSSTATMQKVVRALNKRLRESPHARAPITVKELTQAGVEDVDAKPTICPSSAEVAANDDTAESVATPDHGDPDLESHTASWGATALLGTVILVLIGLGLKLSTHEPAIQSLAQPTRTVLEGTGRLDQAAQRMRQGIEFLGWTEFKKAKESFDRAYEIRHELLGEASAKTLEALRQSAVASCWLADYDEAERVQVDLLRRLAGTSHQALMYAVMADLAVTLGDQGKATNQLELVARDGLLRLVDHPTLDTVKARHNLAVKSLRAESKVAQAEFEAIVRHMQAVHGRRHPTTIGAMMNLAFLYGAQGEAEKSWLMLQDSMDLATQHLGPRNLWTAMILNNVAATRHDSLEILQEIVEPLLASLKHLRSRLSGDHPTLLSIGQNAAAVCWRLGNNQRGIEMMREVVAGTESRFGSDHELTWQRRHWLAIHYKNAQRTKEAIPILERLVAHYSDIDDQDKVKTVRAELLAAKALNSFDFLGISSEERKRLSGFGNGVMSELTRLLNKGEE